VAVSFAGTIKPYFTACYRAHMMMYGDQFDLWDAGQVQAEWNQIHTEVSKGAMPEAGCPEGVWDTHTRNQFLSDFQAWKDAGYPP